MSDNDIDMLCKRQVRVIYKALVNIMSADLSYIYQINDETGCITTLSTQILTTYIHFLLEVHIRIIIQPFWKSCFYVKYDELLHHPPLQYQFQYISRQIQMQSRVALD